jgi:hypothetical protein
MAKNSPRDRRPLTPSRLRALANLTKAIGEAVVQGDLDRALMLLEQRHKAFQGIAWSPENIQEFEPDLFSLWEVDQELLTFCRTWRDALKKRLETLSACHLLQQCYGREDPEAKFVDVRK